MLRVGGEEDERVPIGLAVAPDPVDGAPVDLGNAALRRDYPHGTLRSKHARSRNVVKVCVGPGKTDMHACGAAADAHQAGAGAGARAGPVRPLIR